MTKLFIYRLLLAIGYLTLISSVGSKLLPVWNGVSYAEQ